MTQASCVAAREGRPDAGFTLVELLAALGLLSLLSVILLGSLHLGLKAWERGAVHADRVDHVALVQNFLRRAIEDAYPLFAVDAAAQGRVEFEGTANSLRLLSSAAHALRSGGRSRLSLAAVEGAQGGLDLVVTARPELARDEGAVTRKVLLANIQSVELSYFGRGRSDREPAWHDQWTGEVRLPQLVRIQVTFPPGDRRLWPELAVAPRIGADVGCVYDPLSKQCRGR
jgi:general secretion pathway protein J